MARLVGVDLPRDKRIEVGLTYIYGIGRTSANKILAATGINPDTRVKDLTDAEEALAVVKADLKALNADVQVSQEEYDEVVAIKPMFLVSDYE